VLPGGIAGALKMSAVLRGRALPFGRACRSP
jgi:hypothetical protein